MFKNNKEKESNYISTEEVEKMYKFQKRSFEEKIAEQQEKIDDLVDYVSARFGEEVLDSDIGVRLKNFEKSLNEIENNYKSNLKRNTKELKKEIEKEGQRIAAELNDAQTESYFKLLQKNENDITKIQKFFDEKEENDERIFNLDKLVKAHIENSDAYKKEIQEELKNTNQKIGKINYAGVTSKFDKKIKEECAKLNTKIEEIKNQNKKNTTSSDEQFLQKLEEVQKHFQTNGDEIIKLQQLFINENEKVNSALENNINRVVILDERLSEEVESIDEEIQKIETKTNKLADNFTSEIETINESVQNAQDSVNKLDKKISSKFESINGIVKNAENFVNEFEKKIKNEQQESNVIQKNIEDITNKLDEKFTKKIEKLALSSKNNETVINKLDKKIIKELEKVNEELQSNKNAVNILDKKFTEEVAANIINNTQVSDLEEKLSNKIENIILDVNNNETATMQLKDELTNKITQTREAINKLKDIAKNKNIKIEEKIKLANENIKNTETNLISKVDDVKKEVNSIYSKIENDTNLKIDAKLQETMQAIEGSKIELAKLEEKVLKQNKKDILAETQKVKAEINEQITNNYKETKVELENISESVEDIRNTMQETIETVGSEVLKLKKELKQGIENNDKTDSEILRKDYNKLISKVNNELAKISKDLLNAQKKNQEQNRNLQVKIKAYIDAKVEESNNSGAIEELINDLSISILEREKLQKLEMEELLNKKLKAIQKENEKMINKKIEEMSAIFIRENKTSTKTRPNKVTLYEEVPTKKKSMYNIIDDKQMLKRSAASKTPSLPTKESKSQILKFFYDNEDEF